MAETTAHNSSGRHCCAQVSGGGKAKYDAKRHALVWKFKKFPGESEASLSASVDLIATTKEKRSWAKPPIQLQFHVRALPPQIIDGNCDTMPGGEGSVHSSAR